MVSEKIEARLIASIFMGRGIFGTYFFLINSKGNLSTLSGTGLISFLTVFLAISLIVTAISYGLSKRKSWSWILGLTTVSIYLTTDIILTLFIRPQPPLEFGIDLFLILYLIGRKEVYFENPLKERLGENVMNKE